MVVVADLSRIVFGHLSPSPGDEAAGVSAGGSHLLSTKYEY